MKRYILVVLILILVTMYLFFDVDRIEGTSMTPTIPNKSIALSLRSNKYLKLGDIIQFAKDDGYMIKRIVAMPGSHVVLKDGKLIVDGVVSKYTNYGIGDFESDLWLADDEFFVIGDNRAYSYDSRAFGPIKGNDICGKFLISFPYATLFLATSGFIMLTVSCAYDLFSKKKERSVL